MLAKEFMEKYGITQPRLSYYSSRGIIKRTKGNTTRYDYSVDDDTARKLLDGSYDNRRNRAGMVKVDGKYYPPDSAVARSKRPPTQFVVDMRNTMSKAKSLHSAKKAWRASNGSKVLVIARTFHFDSLVELAAHKEFLDEALNSISKSLALDVSLSTISNNLELSVVYNAK